MAKALTRGQKAAATRAANQAAREANARPNPSAAAPHEREHARAQAAQTPAGQREAQRIRLEQTSGRPFVGGNMGTHQIPEGKPKGRELIVLHGAVGPHARGAYIFESHVEDKARLKELVEMGALQYVDESNDHLSDAPIPTLNEAAFSESPPTLPRVDDIDVDPDDVAASMLAGVGTSGPRSEDADEELEEIADEASDQASSETKTD